MVLTLLGVDVYAPLAYLEEINSLLMEDRGWKTIAGISYLARREPVARCLQNFFLTLAPEINFYTKVLSWHTELTWLFRSKT